VRSTKTGQVLVVLVLVAALLALPAALGGRAALADGGDQRASATFTKWIVSTGTGPVVFNMAGIVSGDVGGGQYVGEVLELKSTASTTKITALYHINGGLHQFTARLHVTQDNATGTAVIKGVVVDGWMRGAQVRGGYQTIAPCGIINAQQGPAGDACFQGTLNLSSDR
jgi:hypothetical protein